MAERSKAWVCGRSPTGIAGSNPAGGMDVCVVCVVSKDKKAKSQNNEDKKQVEKKLCVLSGRGVCDGPITRPEESYRL